MASVSSEQRPVITVASVALLSGLIGALCLTRAIPPALVPYAVLSAAAGLVSFVGLKAVENYKKKVRTDRDDRRGMRRVERRLEKLTPISQRAEGRLHD